MTRETNAWICGEGPWVTDKEFNLALSLSLEYGAVYIIRYIQGNSVTGMVVTFLLVPGVVCAEASHPYVSNSENTVLGGGTRILLHMCQDSSIAHLAELFLNTVCEQGQAKNPLPRL